MAVFIPNKKSSTVTEAILVNWIKMFGPMKYLHVDRGREWMNNELQAVCNKFDIRLTATAAFTPNANGLCERQHAVVDRMMDKNNGKCLFFLIQLLLRGELIKM